MNTFVILQLAILLFLTNREIRTEAFLEWYCHLGCNPSLCLTKFTDCTCGFYMDDCNCCFKCKLCEGERCYRFRKDICEDGCECLSEYDQYTVNFYNKGGTCIRKAPPIEAQAFETRVFAYEESESARLSSQ